MPYRNPMTVIAPKTRWSLGSVLCDTGQGGWSVAEGVWDDSPALAMRWNGQDGSPSPGNPQSHGNPTWFIVPAELEHAVRHVARELDTSQTFIGVETMVPEGWEHGVFRIKVTVEGPLVDEIDKYNIDFVIPSLDNRLFRQDRDYMVPPTEEGAPWRGKIIKGVWESTVSTNGVPEDDNPNPMEVVKHVVRANVIKALAPWMKEKPL